MVTGSDVVLNASAYRKPSEENSIHSFSHVVFDRFRNQGSTHHAELKKALQVLERDVVLLTLPKELEEISSTLIRDNIDYNRDISNLIDPMAQNYIYDYGSSIALYPYRI